MTRPNELSYQPSDSAVHYRFDRRIDLARFAIALPFAVLLVNLGAVVYVKLGYWFDNLYLRVGLLAAASGAAALISTGVVRFGGVRSAAIATVTGTILGLICLYVMWLVWVHDTFVRIGIPVTYWDLASHPNALYRIVRDINRVGTWQYRGNTWRGILLLTVWLIEAGAVMGSAVGAAVHATQRGQILCRNCKSKCQRIRGLRRFSCDRQDEFVAVVENRQFAQLASFEPRDHEDDPELSLELICCPKCGQTSVLSVNRIAWRINDDGRATVQNLPLVQRLIITSDEAQKIRDLKEPEPASAGEQS